jgi:HAD superfamily hydrolase (TIGR01509 family)
VPRPGALNVLNRLCEDGVPLATVSNAAFSGRVLRAELARHGLAESLRFVISSADLGSRKPAALLFETAVQRLGVAASDTWFVGDTLTEDVAGALGAGLPPVWFSHGDTAVRPPDDVPVVHAWSDFLMLYRATIDSAAG